MDSKNIEAIKKEFKLLNQKYNILLKALIVTVVILLIYFQTKFFPFESNDYQAFLKIWLETMKTYGWDFFRKGIFEIYCDYPPLYLYFMLAISPFTEHYVILLKSFSVIFEVVTGIYAYLILRKYIDKNIAIWVIPLVFIIPTVFLNVGVWGQSDIVYSSMIVVSLYYLIENKMIKSSIFIALAFSLKFQTIFIAPIYLFLVFKKRINWDHILLMLGVYVLTFLPSFLMGYPMSSIYWVYMRQAGSYAGSLVLNFPNIYNLFQGNEALLINIRLFGSIITAVVCLFIAYYMYRKRIKITAYNIILFSTFVATLIPFMLPGMHERYLFLTDLLFLILVFLNKKLVYIAFPYYLVSIFGYSNYLFGNYLTGHIIFFILIYIGVLIALLREIWKPNIEVDEEILEEIKE